MQDFIRTVDTVDAFKFKVEMIEKELNEKRKDYEYKRGQIDRKNEEIKRLNNAGGFERLKAKGTNLIANIIIVMLCIAGVMGFTIMSGGDNIPIAIFSVPITGVILAIMFKVKVKRLLEEEREKISEAQRKQRAFKNEINILNKEMGEITEFISERQEAIKQQQEVYMVHMLNQQTLLDKEIETINNTIPIDNKVNAESQDDMKECPQCAELVKFRAKICRFCNYKFPGEQVV